MSVPLLFVSGWNYLGVNGLVRPTLQACVNKRCVYLPKKELRFLNLLVCT